MKWTAKPKVVPEVEYNSGSWHMDSNNHGGKIFLFNYDLSLVPCGYAQTEKEAFEDMLKNIESYESQLKEIRAEIQAHLAELEGEDHEHDSIG